MRLHRIILVYSSEEKSSDLRCLGFSLHPLIMSIAFISGDFDPTFSGVSADNKWQCSHFADERVNKYGIGHSCRKTTVSSRNLDDDTMYVRGVAGGTAVAGARICI